MDLLPSIDELRDELMAHDLAVQEIIALDQYIEQQTQQTFVSSMSECEAPPFQKLIRIATAEGVKRMFKEYRLQKWLKVQDMADTVRQILNAEAPREEEITSNTHVLPEVSQLPRQQPSMVPVAQVIPAENDRPIWRQEPWATSAVTSPVPAHLTRILSPIITPQIQSNADQQGANQMFHSSPHIINRCLFPGGQCPNNGVPEVEPVVGVQSSVGYQPSNDTDRHVPSEEHSEASYFQPEGTNSIVSTGFPDQRVPAQSYIPATNNTLATAHQEHLGNTEQYPEHLNDIDEEMDWDSDYDSNLDDSEENLAGVLFATQSLLPDEQAVRLDVEMGDMGVGHVMFDRVSAAWAKYHCAFNRHG